MLRGQRHLRRYVMAEKLRRHPGIGTKHEYVRVQSVATIHQQTYQVPGIRYIAVQASMSHRVRIARGNGLQHNNSEFGTGSQAIQEVQPACVYVL